MERTPLPIFLTSFPQEVLELRLEHARGRVALGEQIHLAVQHHGIPRSELAGHGVQHRLGLAHQLREMLRDEPVCVRD